MDESNCDVSVSSMSYYSACLTNDVDDSLLTETSCSEEGCDIITKEMLEEEKRLAEETAQKEEERKKELQELMKNEEKEQRYKRLMHLLSKSQFYSSFLLQKLELNKSESERNNPKKVRKPKQLDVKDNTRTLIEKNPNINQESIEENNLKNEDEVKAPSSQINRTSSRKRKANTMYYNETYNIEDVISKEDIENAKRVRDENEINTVTGSITNDTADQKMKINSLGFEVPIDQPDLLEGGILRDYQMEGVNWLKLLFESGMNGILADEMGLGKTIQLIAHICFLVERNVQGPYLIVAPLSTLSNWILEFERFAPQVPVVLFHGSEQERRRLYSSLCKVHKVGQHSTKPVVITSYEIPPKEVRILESLEWQYIIVDEGHRIKNYNALLSRVLRMLTSKNRLLLTGTPLQNSLTELWSLLNFLLPELFDDLSTFEAWFDLQEMDNAEGAEKIIQQEREQKVISTLHQILFPFLLRRLKSEVELNIPPKKEVMVYCPMTPLQMEMYKVIVDNTLANLLSIDIEDVPLKRRSSSQYRKSFKNKSGSMDKSVREKLPLCEFFPLENMPICRALTNKLGATVPDGRPGFINRLRMQNASITLKHIVNHPYLVRMPVRYDKLGNKIIHVTEDIKTVSGKLLVLDAMLAKLKEGGHKVLLFCTSCMMMDLLEEYMIISNYEYRRLDGASKLLDRKNDIYDFNTDQNVFIFLLTTRAGGLGINLTGADTVIFYNSDWNPQADLQAQDRAHRIGQTKPVVVYRFNVAGTADEKVIRRAASKRKLEKIVMKQGAFNPAKKNEIIDLQELRELLKTTDTCKEMQSNGFIFSDEELEQLLDRNDMFGETGSSKKPDDSSKEVVDTSEQNDENTVPRKKLYEVLKLEK